MHGENPGGGGGHFAEIFFPNELRACERAQRQFLDFHSLHVPFVREVKFKIHVFLREKLIQ